MDSPIPCPCCFQPVPPEADSCANCRLGKEELELARAAERQSRLLDAQRRRDRRLQLAAALLAGLGAGFFLFARWTPPSAAPVAASAPAPAAEAPELSPSPRVPEPARPAPPALPEPPEPVPPPMMPDHFLLSGTVRDLRTLRPISGGELKIERDGMPMIRLSVPIDPLGRWLAQLPRAHASNGRVELTLAHPRYATELMHEPDIPYAELSRSKRESLIESAADGSLHGRLIPEPAESALEIRAFAAPVP